LKDGGKINAELNAEAYPGVITPKNNVGAPGREVHFYQGG
jgi:hypothetical protein